MKEQHLNLKKVGGGLNSGTVDFAPFTTYAPSYFERNNMSDQEIIAETLAKDLKLMIRNEIDRLLNSFLEREESELKDLFAKVKEEESERLEIMMKGIKSHTDRIKALEEFTGINTLPF